MKVYTLHTKQFIPASPEEAWAFFSSPANLPKITPPDMDFKIVTLLNGEPIYQGMEIDYLVTAFPGLPMKWRTLITHIKEGVSFTDKQIKGPYALWEHTHTFTPSGEGVQMTDEVRYALPMGLLGSVAHTIFIRKKLSSIFSYREKIVEQTFGIS